METKTATAESKTKFIVLDSNIMIADYWLRSPSFVLLRTFLNKTGAKLIVPRIVLEEVINHHREELGEIKSEIRDVHRKIARLLRVPRGPISEIMQVIKRNANDPYNKFLEHEFSGMGAQVIDYDKIPHKDVVDRDLKRIRPFQKSGKGYRDTLLWETIIRNCLIKGAVTVFITQNSADFSDAKGELHEHLETDIQKMGVNKADFKLFRDLVQFTDSLVVPFLKARKDFALLVENKKVEGLDLNRVCEENNDTIVAAIEQSPSTMTEDPGHYEPSVDVVYVPQDFEIISASEISEDRLLVIFGFRAQVSFTFFLTHSEYAAMSEEKTSQIQIIDGNWNESVMRVESYGEIDFRCRLTFDTAEHDVESFEVEDVERVQEDSR